MCPISDMTGLIMANIMKLDPDMRLANVISEGKHFSGKVLADTASKTTFFGCLAALWPY